MKKNKASPTWSGTAEQAFSDSPIGQQITQLFHAGSKSQRQLSELILRDPVYAATHGIEDLSAATGISTATISRYVKQLGLNGFSEFRGNLAEAVHALIGPVSKLGQHFDTTPDQGGAALGSLRAATEQLQALHDPALLDAVAATQEKITAARQVWVMGFGISAHLAAILAMGLQPYRDGVNVVVESGGTEAAAARLVNVHEDDLLIPITFPRYSADLVSLTGHARQSGVGIAGLTDVRVSPIAPYCDELLLAPAAHPVLSASSLPGLAVVEALVSSFVLSDPAHLERSARLAAVMAKYLSMTRQDV